MPCRLFGRLVGLSCGSISASLNDHADGGNVPGMVSSVEAACMMSAGSAVFPPHICHNLLKLCNMALGLMKAQRDWKPIFFFLVLFLFL
jgi:hypothetical protein